MSIQPTPSFHRPTPVALMLDRAFQLYRDHFLELIRIASLAIVPLTLFQLLVLENGLVPFVQFFQTWLVLILVGSMLVVLIDSQVRSSSITARQAFLRARGKYISVIGATLLQALVIWIPASIVSFCAVSVALLFHSSAPWLFAGIVALFVFPITFFLTMRFSMTYQVVILESGSAIDSIRRSWRLTQPTMWYCIRVLLPSTALVYLLGEMPNVLVTQFVFLYHVGSVGKWFQVSSVVLTQLGVLIALPFQYTVPVLLYHELRARVEGTDLEAAVTAYQDHKMINDK